MTGNRTAALLLALQLAAIPVSAGEMPGFAVAAIPTPVFSDPAFPRLFGGDDGNTLVTDRCGQLRSLEFLAPQGSVFTILSTASTRTGPIYRVTTDEYPYPTSSGYYVDGRFLRLTAVRPPERQRTLPPHDEIIRRLRFAVGRPYVWGGNVREGAQPLLTIFPSRSPLAPERAAAWTLAGLDCSGLLYEATNGVTPRNTSTLIRYGSGLPIAGLDPRAIARQTRPLDLIVWNGHVMIVLDGKEVIESRLACGTQGNGGVRVRPLAQTLADVMRKRKPADLFPANPDEGSRTFVIRRWYTGSR